MITINIDQCDFGLRRPIGSSDHLMLELGIGEELGKLAPARDLGMILIEQ